MSSLSTFRAIYCSGLYIEEPALITALSLLFEKIYLPNNIELIREFAKKYEIRTNPLGKYKGSIETSNSEGKLVDLFLDLEERQRQTAENYIMYCSVVGHKYRDLFPDVLESAMFPEGTPQELSVVHTKTEGTLYTFKVTLPSVHVVSGAGESFPELIEKGYVPIVGRFHLHKGEVFQPDRYTARQLAALLAMKSIEMIFPSTKEVEAGRILEARHRLRDQLPQFWAAMLRLSTELRHGIKHCASEDEIFKQTAELVDTVVRPAAIDLKKKIEMERKEWFYKILEPVGKGIRLLLGFPPLSQQELLTNAMILGTDLTMTSAERMRTIEALRGKAGLTFLLDAERTLSK